MSAVSKFMLFDNFHFRSHQLLFRTPLRLFNKPTPGFSSLRFHRYSSSGAVETVADSDTDASSSPVHHPWPEWVTFVDRLKSKGYFEGANNVAVDDSESARVYTDMNLVKDASLSFARDRYDVFKSLSLEDIQTVVERGCPNLLRKAVNSAKRLRAHVRLDEGDVCSTCNLRGSCDRAYVILKESEASARTVDVVRILLFYALDPLVVKGGEKPPGRYLIDASARKLISDLIKLSETAPSPSLPTPVSKSLNKKERAVDQFEDELSKDVEMKRGDWMCPKCNFMNFSKNLQCLKCKEDGPKGVDAGQIEMKKGDWNCPECGFMNFARNMRCLRCETEGPKRVAMDEVEMKKGDWNCPQCGFMNFASNKKCLRCPQSRPKRQLNSGEWECPSCDFLNYKRNKACLRCNSERPKASATGYEEQIWKSRY